MTSLVTTTVTVHLNEDYSCEITKYIGSCGEYYNFNGVNYDIHFPIDWVFQYPINVMIFGPETCYSCFTNGYYNGVFVGYCSDCARIVNYKRGNGMIGNGIENEEGLLEENSIWNVYLQNTCLDDIGDENLLVDYNYKLFYNNCLEDDNDNDTVTYDESLVYTNSEEDSYTIPFSECFVDVDSESSFVDDDNDTDNDDNDMFMDIDSIS